MKFFHFKLFASLFILLLTTSLGFVTAHAADICPVASEYFETDVKEHSFKRNGRFYTILYWQEKGIDAVLQEPNAIRKLASFSKEKKAKKIMKYHDRLVESREKNKKPPKPPKDLMNAPSATLLKITEEKLGCKYDPENRDIKAAAAKKAKIEAERAKFDAVRTLLKANKKPEADAKMREYYPKFMIGHDAAVRTKGMACLPAAGPTATKEEVLTQFNLYKYVPKFGTGPMRHTDTYAYRSDIYKRIKGLKSAYAAQLVSRFGVNVIAENPTLVGALANCKGFYDKSCAVMRTDSLSYRKLTEYSEALEKGEIVSLDRSEVPILKAYDTNTLKNFPSAASELWKESMLGTCSNQHQTRELKIPVYDTSHSRWKNPTQPAALCKKTYDFAFKKIQQDHLKVSDAGVSWVLQYEKNDRAQSCDMWPDDIAPPKPVATATGPVAKTYTLEQGLQDMAQAMSCSYQTEQCVNDGQYQRCRMVTVTTC